MASGVKISARCKDEFKSVKMNTKKTDKKNFMVLKMSDDLTEIVIDDQWCDKHVENFHCLLKELPQDDGRYIIYDYPCKNQAGAARSKLILVTWCPENIKTKMKMLYAASKQALKTMIDVDIPDLQCDGVDDITEEDIIAKIK